jgi:hypothetical protein
MSEREHSNTFKYSKLFVENQQLMEHSELLMFPQITNNLCARVVQHAYLYQY